MKAHQVVAHREKLTELVPLLAGIGIGGMITAISYGIAAWSAYELYKFFEKYNEDPDQLSDDDWADAFIDLCLLFVPAVAKLGKGALVRLIPKSWQRKGAEWLKKTAYGRAKEYYAAEKARKARQATDIFGNKKYDVNQKGLKQRTQAARDRKAAGDQARNKALGKTDDAAEIITDPKSYSSTIGKSASPGFRSKAATATLGTMTFLAGPLNTLIGIGGLWLAWETFSQSVEGLDPNSPEYKKAFGAFLTVVVTQLLLGNILSKAITYIGAIPILAASGGRLALTAALTKISQPAVKAALIYFINTAEGKQWLEGMLSSVLGGNYESIGTWSKSILDLAGLGSLLPDGKKAVNGQVQGGQVQGGQSEQPGKQTSTGNPIPQSSGYWYMDLKTGEITNKPGDDSAMVAKGPGKTPLSSAALSTDPGLRIFRQKEVAAGRPDPLAQLYKPGEQVPYLAR